MTKLDTYKRSYVPSLKALKAARKHNKSCVRAKNGNSNLDHLATLSKLSLQGDNLDSTSEEVNIFESS